MPNKLATYTLSDPDGEISQATVGNITWAVDAGIQVSVGFNRGYDIRHDRMREFDLVLQDALGNEPIEFPPMYSKSRSRTVRESVDGSRTGGFTLYDAANCRLRLPNQSFPTFLATQSGDIIDMLADHAEVTINGFPSWYVGQKDIKEQVLDSALRAWLEMAAYDLVTELDGTLQCRAWEYNGGTLSQTWANLAEDYDPWEVFTGCRVGKFSSMPDGTNQNYIQESATTTTQALEVPLYGPYAEDGGSGHDGLQAVCFLDEDDKVVAFYSFNGLTNNQPVYAVNLATKIQIVTDPIYGDVIDYPADQPARVHVTGTLEEELPEGVDREFIYPAVPTSGPDDSLGDWPSSKSYINSDWDSASNAIARRPYLLAKENSAADTLTMTRDLIDTSPRLLQRFTYLSAAYKVWSITWDLDSQRTTLTLRRI